MNYDSKQLKNKDSNTKLANDIMEEIRITNNNNKNNNNINGILKKKNKTVNKKVSFVTPNSEEKKKIFYINKNMPYQDLENDKLNEDLLPNGKLFVYP